MALTEEISSIIGQPESEELEYKAVLPPSRSLAQMIAALANTKGGYIVLGVFAALGKPDINGLSEDFHANAVTHKAIDLLSPKPLIDYGYVTYNKKRLYVIKVDKSKSPVLIESKIYIRKGDRISLSNPPKETTPKKNTELESFSKTLNSFRTTSTGAKSKFLDHYQSVLNIIGDLGRILYPDTPAVPTTNAEGKILIRIMFSSCADNFEIYLSDLLYEIYLANPASLKSEQQVSIKEVLNCADLQEFVIYWAKKKLSKLQRGSVKAFISDTNEINDLNVLDKEEQKEIDKILQVRHLYAHRNGIVDEKFLQFYPGQYLLNQEHQLSIKEMLDVLLYLADTVNKIDQAAVTKHKLATID